MKFISSSSSLLKQLLTINGVIGTRTVIPILEYFLFEVADGKLTVTGTDLEVSMRSTLSVESKEEGRIAVPAHYIIDILKALPEQPVTITILSETKTIELTSDSGKYKIAGESADDFPKFPLVEGTTESTIPASVLMSAISTTAFSVGTDEMRPAMTGLFFQMTPDELRFVATDGNKLVLYKRTDVRAEQEDAFILPKKALTLLKNALPTEDIAVSMHYNKLNAKFSFKNVELICRLIDERFPDYKAAIPIETPNHLRIDRAEMLQAMRRTIIFSNKTTSQVRFKISGSELQITAQDLDYSNEAQERLRCDYQGTDMEIGFSGRYLIDMLGTLTSKDVEFSLSEYNRPGVIRPLDQNDGEEILMLVMPIVLNY
ncbi:MAG: DNA polymerase III subunit beta [Bacteroidota bacterium]|nr:DNA polymerase III subunit beta [Bacteroidota bacterium]